MSKTDSRILTNILSICLILATFLGSINFWCYRESFYTSQHNKIKLYGKSIAEHIGIDDEQLQGLTSFVLDYLNDKNDSLNMQMTVNGIQREVFTQDEKQHMADVKSLNFKARAILVVSVVLILVTSILIRANKINLAEVYNAYKRVLLYSLMLFGAVGLWILIDFDSFWTFFHHIFFSGNDLWLLDLRTDILIMMVPPEFFNNLVIRILVSFILLITVIYLFLYSLQKRRIGA